MRRPLLRTPYTGLAVLLAGMVPGLAFGKELGPPADAAGRMAQAVAQAHALEDDPKRPDLEPALRKIESQFILLLRQEPDNPAVRVQTGWFYARWNGALRTPDPALLDLVQASPDPAGLAKSLVGPGGGGGLAAHILLAALDVRPADSSLWEAAALSVQPPAWKTAFQEEAYRTAASGPTAARLAAGWLDRLLVQGLTRQALTAYQGMPPTLRERLDRGERSDLRLGLAAAAFLEGDRETARRLSGLAKQASVQGSTKPSAEEKRARQAAAVTRRLLAQALAPAGDDPFALFAEELTLDETWGGVTGDLFLARLAARDGYPALAAYGLGLAERKLDDTGEEPFEPLRGVPPRVRAAAAAVGPERAALSHGLHEEAQAAESAARNGLRPDPAAATIARLLRAPLPAAFEEHPLPEGVALVSLPDKTVTERLAAAAKELNVPSGAPLARVERDGRRVAALVSSQGYDPVGEVSPGAYWVLLSGDGGATWSGPFYTGLRIYQPYVVRPVSNLPLLAGDHLHVEVEVHELDTGTIFFPPVGLTAKRTTRGLYLDIPLAALTQDTDGDGLTDLAEARLLTDPAAPDTDGDGIPDGADPLPTVRQSEDSSPAAQALAAFAGSMEGVGRRALVEGLHTSGNPLLCCSPAGKVPEPEKALFFTGERSLFAALHPARRIVVLTRDEAEAARKRFGPFYPIDLDLFLLDRSGRHALLIWSSSWQGGTVRVDEKDGIWTATEVSSWIT